MGLQTIVLEESSRFGRIAAAIGVLWRFRPDIVNAHNPGALTYALLAKFRRNAHVIMTRHGQEAINPLPSGIKLRFTDSVIAVSEAAGQAMKRRRPETAGHIDVIRNGVHLDRPARSREAVRAELGLGDGLVGVIVARIDRLKGHRILLDALKLLKDRGTAITVLIVGDGPERAAMEENARQHGLDRDWVRFLGFRDDIADLLAASDLFLLPSLTEGMPLSVLEAMAQRLPVVATSVGGIPELMQDGVHGLLIPTENPAALAEAIGKLADDPAKRAAMGESGYNRVKDDFSFAEMARRYEDLYFRFCW
jgi:glycosyltransferase involved in cell wall biosynthesis